VIAVVVVVVVVVVVYLSLLHHAQFYLECTISSMVAINILITHALQRTTHSLAPVHSAVGFSIATMDELTTAIFARLSLSFG